MWLGEISTAYSVARTRHVEADEDSLDIPAFYPNHGAKFFGLVGKIIPDWKKRKDLLERTLA
jgi:hypothetical protein